MDARSIAATAANKGYLTAATDLDVNYTKPKYFFDSRIYENRVFDSKGVADPSVEIQFGPNIKDWPAMSALDVYKRQVMTRMVLLSCLRKTGLQIYT